ncbi:MAG: HAD family hydrolase [Candidatus Helarchaeota archaeon]
MGFDLYSTLINTDNYDQAKIMMPVYSIIQALGYNETFEQFLKIRETIYWKWRRYREENHIELPSQVWWREILETLQVIYSSEHVHQIINSSHQAWRKQISLYPNVKALLSSLKKSYQVVCISNISDGDLAREDMAIFGILDIFDYVVMSSDLGIRKPSPKIFEYVLKHLNIEKSEMIFIGDTLYDDVQGAKAANLRMAIHIKRARTYFFPDYYIKPDRTITQLVDLLEFLPVKIEIKK